MKKITFITLIIWMTFSSLFVHAHFGAIIPSDVVVTQKDSKALQLKLMFLHPFENQYLNLEKPAAFAMQHRGRSTDLIQTLKQVKIKGFNTWETTYTIKRPGDHIFHMTPQPYWEEAEDCFIIHYTKVIVNALGLEDAWDKPLGLETEIIPLTRPYGLWTNNVFTGQVLLNGKPAPHSTVEVEYLNDEDAIKTDSDSLITQIVKTDANGIFTYAMPRAGWWGFAALHTATRKINRDGVAKDVEIGAVIWVKTKDME